MDVHCEGVLENYRSLRDPLLAHYLKKQRVFRHLHKACLITDDGKMLTDDSHRLLSNKLEQKEFTTSYLRSSYTDPIATERVECDHRFIMKKLEEYQRVENVRRIREQTGQRPREVTLPLVTFDPSKFSASSFPMSCRSLHNGNCDGNMSSFRHGNRDCQKYAKASPLRKKRGCRHDASQMCPLCTSVHCKDWISPFPGTERPASFSARNWKPSEIKKQAAAKIVSDGSTQWSRCMITLHYCGSARSPDDPELTDSTMDLDTILIKQKCCGSSVRTVFERKVALNSDFTFTSKRHVGCPFSVILYVNGCQPSQLRDCCEHSCTAKSRRLGSQHGHFSVVGVIAAKPCSRCQLAADEARCAELRRQSVDTSVQDARNWGHPSDRDLMRPVSRGSGSSDDRMIKNSRHDDGDDGDDDDDVNDDKLHMTDVEDITSGSELNLTRPASHGSEKEFVELFSDDKKNTRDDDSDDSDKLCEVTDVEDIASGSELNSVQAVSHSSRQEATRLRSSDESVIKNKKDDDDDDDDDRLQKDTDVEDTSSDRVVSGNVEERTDFETANTKKVSDVIRMFK